VDDRGASNVVGFAVAFGVFALAFSFSVSQMQEPARVAGPASDVVAGLHAADGALDLLLAKPGVPSDWLESDVVPTVPGLRARDGPEVSLARLHALARGDVGGARWTYEDAREGLGVEPSYFRLRVRPVLEEDALADALARRRVAYVAAAGLAAERERAALVASGAGFANDTAGDVYPDADAAALRALSLRLLGHDGAAGAGLAPASSWAAADADGAWYATPSRLDASGRWNYTHGEDSRLVLGAVALADVPQGAPLAVHLEAILSPTTLLPLLGAPVADGAEVETCALPCAGAWRTFAALPARETLGPVSATAARPEGEAALVALRWNGSRLVAPPPGALVASWGQGPVVASARVDVAGVSALDVRPGFASTRIDALVFGSEVDHATLAATAEGLRFGRSVQAWAAAGGGVIVLPSARADGALLAPAITAANEGAAGSAPGAFLDALDAAHPLLTFPNALAHGLYGNATPRWAAAAQGAFHRVLEAQVPGEGRLPVLEARHGNLATGEGPAVVASVRVPAHETAAFLENALAWVALDDLTIDYGPSVPLGSTVFFRERTVWIDGGATWGTVNGRVQLFAWR